MAVDAGFRELHDGDGAQSRSEENVDLDPREPEQAMELVQVLKRGNEQHGHHDRHGGDHDSAARPVALPRAPEHDHRGAPEARSDEGRRHRHADGPGEELIRVLGENEQLRPDQEGQGREEIEQRVHPARHFAGAHLGVGWPGHAATLPAGLPETPAPVSNSPWGRVDAANLLMSFKG